MVPKPLWMARLKDDGALRADFLNELESRAATHQAGVEKAVRAGDLNGAALELGRAEGVLELRDAILAYEREERYVLEQTRER